MSEPILKVENMNKKFGSTVALNYVSLSVYPGEISGLIGENGSGKSTVTSIVRLRSHLRPHPVLMP